MAPHLQGKSFQRHACTHTHTQKLIFPKLLCNYKKSPQLSFFYKKNPERGETLTSAPKKLRPDVLPAAASLSFSSKKYQEGANKPVSVSQRAFCLPSGSRNQSLKQLDVGKKSCKGWLIICVGGFWSSSADMRREWPQVLHLR